MTKKHPYTCPRCGYVAKQKSHMNKHLYELKKPCPATHQDIELTDEIKQYILNNRVYHPPKQTPEQIIYQQINNIQQINNYITTKMDNKDKIEYCLEQVQQPLLHYLPMLENKYEEKRNSYENDEREYNGTIDTINMNDLFTMLDNCTSGKEIHEMNLMYDKVTDKLLIYEEEWKDFVFDQGIRELLEKIQEAYLDCYEEYLLRQYSQTTTRGRDKQRIKETLQTYYEFLECFDVQPRLSGYKSCQEDWLMELDEGPLGNMRRNIRDEMKASKLKEVRRAVYNIVKKNCMANVVELNKQLMEYIKMDATFRDKILSKIRPSLV